MFCAGYNSGGGFETGRSFAGDIHHSLSPVEVGARRWIAGEVHLDQVIGRHRRRAALAKLDIIFVPNKDRNNH